VEYADPPQLGDQLVLVTSVVQRPLPPDQRPGQVELGADLGHHPRREEVGVDVEETGEAETVDDLVSH
jgi:hypothetical protein